MGIAIQDLWDRSPFSLSELMTIGLSALVLVILVLPMGYVIARLIQLDAPSLNYRIFIWAALGTSAVIVVWTWVYMLGGAWATVRVVLVVPLLLSSIYFLVDVGRRLNIDFLAKRHHLVRLLATSSLLLLVAIFYLAPRTVDGEISQRQLIGPDSVGYSNAVSALLKEARSLILNVLLLLQRRCQTPQNSWAIVKSSKSRTKGCRLVLNSLLEHTELGFLQLWRRSLEGLGSNTCSRQCI